MEIAQIVELVQALNQTKQKAKPPFQVGKNYFIRTITLYYTGKLTQINGQWLTLEDAAWIADTGRFHDFLKDGKCNEYEGFLEPVNVPLRSVVDISEWKHSLFRGQK